MAIASDNKFPKIIITEGTAPSSPSAGDQKLFIDSSDHKLKRKNSGGSVTTIEGGGAGSDTTAIHSDTANEISGITEKTTLTGNDLFIIEDSAAAGVKKKVKQSNLGAGGAPTDAEYVTTASNGTLSAEVAIPGLAGSADILGAAGAGTAEEFDTSSDPFTWSSAVTSSDSDTTVKSHYYVKDTAAAAKYGTKAWAPAGAFDARCKISIGNDHQSNTCDVGLYVANTGLDAGALCYFNSNGSNQFTVQAYTESGSTFTQRGGSGWIVGTNTIYLRMTRDGSNNISFYFSMDGHLWQFQVTQAHTFTVAKIGFRISGGATTAHYLLADWLRTDV